MKPFKCTICSKLFGLRGNLNRHIRVHTGERPYKCQICQKSFTELGAHKKHITSVHLKVKAFGCPFCGHRFNQNQSLENHIRSHIKEKPYPCHRHLCGKEFASSSSRIRHLETHSRKGSAKPGVKPKVRFPRNKMQSDVNRTQNAEDLMNSEKEELKKLQRQIRNQKAEAVQLDVEIQARKGAVEKLNDEIRTRQATAQELKEVIQNAELAAKKLNKKIKARNPAGSGQMEK